MQQNSWEDGNAGKRIGANLRQFRTSRGMSMEHLANKIGISKLTLMNVERGDGNPTLAVIWKIANGLNIPVTALLSIESDVSIARREDGLKLASSDQIFVAEPLFQSHGLYELYRGYLQPKAEYASSAHQFGVREYVTVMSGALNIEVGDKTYYLKEYDSIKFKGDLDHKYTNPSSELAILHFVISYHSM
ncbi:XRE family transcriptional regulator [Sporolactobacillus sp. CPB3-1]|uniref:XRE family transcriptional regulator n=1 Tax=Sporolactobacillus mangiferae TaxID=2940498 RepID=A0ABT0MBD8_9BACL|nr:XRE family transcriptional regulator [Sporolactobacillus mangiferae]MCL1631660.1 XRE family transcriptional regulator [Sporolactobacillus mangiferae]